MINPKTGVSQTVHELIEGLAGEQRVAFEALSAGQRFPAAARAAGVCRSTVYRWIRSDPRFRAAYNAWRQESVESAQSRLVNMVDDAVDVIDHALKYNDAKVATTLLKSLGAMRAPGRGSTDPQVLELKMALGRMRDKYRASKAMARHLLSKLGVPPAEQDKMIDQYGIVPTLQSVRAAQAAAQAGGDDADEATDEADEPMDESGRTIDETTDAAAEAEIDAFFSDPRNKSIFDKALQSCQPVDRSVAPIQTTDATAEGLSHDLSGEAKT